MPRLVWFRSDLRTHDNTALYYAARAKRGIVGVFVVCHEQWQSHDWADIKVAFLLRNLCELSDSLAKLNIALRVVTTPRFDQVPKVLCKLAEEADCEGIWFNREYEVNERRRDEAVAEMFDASGRSVHNFSDQTVYEPGELRTNKGDFYTVYTPFKRAFCAKYKEDGFDVLGRAAKQPEMIGEPDAIPDAIDGFDMSRDRDDLWTAGERSAGTRLGKFVNERMTSYDDDRDYPGVHGTSALSPYLAVGVLSPRQCFRAALDANENKIDSGNTGAARWISELIWREFYRSILVGFPRVCRHQPFQLGYRDIEWAHNDEHFTSWCEGRTGYPIVDAAMRQLAQTGWMHNRCRMIVAMFLTKNLFLDWRLGERHFMRHLVDGDLAQNNGGWQWSASTGTDAQPYFRVFNPVSQSEKFDWDGEYIRRFVPELADVDSGSIHDPAKLPRLALGDAYPEPIVDHKATRKTAIERFKAYRD